GNSYVITAAGAGAFTAGNVGVSGSAGGDTVAVTANESAADVATAVNGVQSKTNVSATADTSVALTVTSGSFFFTLGNGNGAAGTNPVTVSATITGTSANDLSPLVQAVNAQTSTTGVVATVNSSGKLTLTQEEGKNISISGYSGTGTLAAGGTTLAATGTTSATIQGVVTLQSTNGFTLNQTAGSVGLGSSASLTSLSSINITSLAGANSALSTVNFAIQSLENIGGQLGATQQQLQATVSNLQTAASNLTTAQGVVQDANIPQVTTQLTQEQILAQAGVSALAQSTQLQQSFLKLLQG
ncbi:MAG: flagellin, partial [Stellaceae bacterium]